MKYLNKLRFRPDSQKSQKSKFYSKPLISTLLVFIFALACKTYAHDVNLLDALHNKLYPNKWKSFKKNAKKLFPGKKPFELLTDMTVAFASMPSGVRAGLSDSGRNLNIVNIGKSKLTGISYIVFRFSDFDSLLNQEERPHLPVRKIVSEEARYGYLVGYIENEIVLAVLQKFNTDLEITLSQSYWKKEAFRSTAKWNSNNYRLIDIISDASVEKGCVASYRQGIVELPNGLIIFGTPQRIKKDGSWLTIIFDDDYALVDSILLYKKALAN